MINKLVWVSKADGVIKNNGADYSNEEFVNTILNDTTSMGKFMSTIFPSPTKIVLNGSTPASWIPWEVPERIEIEKINISNTLEEIPFEKRMFVSRGELSSRVRALGDICHYSVSYKGITDSGVPDNIYSTIESIVNICYALVERNTTASLSSQKRKASPLKRSKYAATEELIKTSSVIDLALLESYSEPSIALMKRFYCLASIYGSDNIKAIVNEVYANSYKRQIDSVISSEI